MHDVERIGRMIHPSIEEMGYRLVRVTFGGGGRPTLQIMAEPLDGRPMTVEDCATISRMISALLDVDDPISIAYMLEVSSPGIDRPLLIPADYRRFAGFEAKIELKAPLDGRKRFQGVIGWDEIEGGVSIQDATSGAVILPFSAIGKAKLVLTDALIAANQDGHIPPPAPQVPEKTGDTPSYAAHTAQHD